MKSNFTINDQSYPGHFIHPLEDKESIQGDEMMTTAFWKKLPVFIQESDIDISIDVTLPGLKREDFLVSASDGVITIADIRQTTQRGTEFQVSRFTAHPPACFIKQISLPASADPEFLSAEYADGILKMVIAKHTKPSNNRYCRIAVY